MNGLDIVHIDVRAERRLRDELRKLAKENRRSLNQEIIERLARSTYMKYGEPKR